MGSYSKHTAFISILLALLAPSCIPQMEKGSGQAVITNSGNVDQDAINQQLVKVSTGQETLNDMTSLKNSGYNIQVQFASQSELQAMNGHTGGGYKISGSTIVLFINNALSTQEQAHVVAHEMVHVKDDLQIDSVLNQYPNVRSAAEDFVSRYRTAGLNSFGEDVISYVLGTVFCAEARAYTKNQQLSNEGLTTENFSKGASLPQFIDQNYISKFGTQYGPNANVMNEWCLSKRSIQNQLVW
jgi:hypothetical protein